MNTLTALSIALGITLGLVAIGVTVAVSINRLERLLWRKRMNRGLSRKVARQPWSSR